MKGEFGAVAKAVEGERASCAGDRVLNSQSSQINGLQNSYLSLLLLGSGRILKSPVRSGSG